MYLFDFPQDYGSKANKKIKKKKTKKIKTSNRKNIVRMQSNFIEITLRQGCSPVNLLHIFRIAFLKNTSGWLLLNRELYKSAFSIYSFKKLVFICLCSVFCLFCFEFSDILGNFFENICVIFVY